MTLSAPSSQSSLPATSTLPFVCVLSKSTITSKRSPPRLTRFPRTIAPVVAGSQRSRLTRRAPSSLRSYWMPRLTRLLLEPIKTNHQGRKKKRSTAQHNIDLSYRGIFGLIHDHLLIYHHSFDCLRHLSGLIDGIQNLLRSLFHQRLCHLFSKLIRLVVRLNSFCYLTIDALVTSEGNNCSLHS